MKFSSSPEAQFFTSSYFIANICLIIAYPAMRLFTTAGNRDLRHKDTFGFSYENSIIYTGLILMMISFSRATSLRGFLLDGLTIGKIVVVCLLFFAKFYYCIYYAILCGLVWLVVPYPKYRANNKFIKIRDEQQFDQIINKHLTNPTNNHSMDLQNYQYRDKDMHFIQFYADWMIPCMLAKELWYSYSNKYTTNRLQFLQINVEQLPELAKRYNINTTGFSKQLPTVLILQDAQETIRFPPIKQNSKVDRVVKLDYKILLTFFDLESRYLQTRQFEKESEENTGEKKIV